MKRVIAIADRASLVSMKLLAALNMLAFLLFLAVLLIAAGTSILSVRTVRERHDPAHWQSVVPTRFAT